MKPYYENENGKLYHGDAIKELQHIRDGSVDCCITSPPYWGLRDYGNISQMGLEPTPEEYVDNMVALFRSVYNVLSDNGTLWLNLGDSYYNNYGGGSDSCATGDKKALQQRGIHNVPKHDFFKIKDICGIPWRVAFGLQEPWFKCQCGFEGREKDTFDDLGGKYCTLCGSRLEIHKGWYLRQDIIWHKPNPMPESVKDRCTSSHEYIFLLSKSPKYYYDNEAIKEQAKPDNTRRNRDDTRLNNTPGRSKMGGLKTNHYTKRNKRSVWTVNTKPYKGAHFATFNPELITPCVLAGCPKNGTILDPFFGAGTTGLTANKYDRKFIGIELNSDYCEIAAKRIEAENRQLKLF